MITTESLTHHFRTAFTPHQTTVLAEAITDSYRDLVKTSDFNDLKAIVKELAESQQRTEARVEQLAVAQQRTEARVEQLAVAQQRTEARVEQLAVAQQRTEARVEQLAVAQQGLAESQQGLIEAQQRTENSLNKLTQVVTGLKQEVGGLSRSMSFALENEVYRTLPAFLQTHHDIILHERIIRTDIGGEEINFFAHGERAGKPICLVGETKLRLDERRSGGRAVERLVTQLERKAQAVKHEHLDCEIVLLVVTHYARPVVLEQMQKQGVLVVQSFDW